MWIIRCAHVRSLCWAQGQPLGKVSHFALFGQTQFTQLTAAIILRSLLFFDYEQRFPATPLPSHCIPLSIVRSHSVHLCSRCAKPNYMACNKGRSKFSYNLWQQRIKKERRGRGRGGGGSEQKSNYKMGCCTRCAHFRCAEG